MVSRESMEAIIRVSRICETYSTFPFGDNETFKAQVINKTLSFLEEVNLNKERKITIKILTKIKLLILNGEFSLAGKYIDRLINILQSSR